MAYVIEPLSNLLIEESPVSLNYLENPSARRLLDVLVAILAEEYIQTAKENPEIFSK